MNNNINREKARGFGADFCLIVSVLTGQQ